MLKCALAASHLQEKGICECFIQPDITQEISLCFLCIPCQKYHGARKQNHFVKWREFLEIGIIANRVENPFVGRQGEEFFDLLLTPS